ncbi:MAG: hypothetical protein AAGI44_07195 [Pseudomonadota bacterium]
MQHQVLDIPNIMNERINWLARACLVCFAFLQTPTLSAEENSIASVTELAPAIRIQEPVAAGQIVSMSVSGLDPDEKYWLTIVPANSNEGEYTDWQDIKKVENADVYLDARPTGAYEARLHTYKSGYPLVARLPFTVVAANGINSASDSEDGNTNTQLSPPIAGRPAIEVTAPLIEGQVISMTVSGLDDKEKYWVTVVNSNSKIGDYSDWQDLNRVGSADVQLKARPSGNYEARLHSYDQGHPLKARASFTIAPTRLALDSPGNTAMTSAGAGVVEGVSAVRTLFPEVFTVIQEYDFPNTLNRALAQETATEALETLLLFTLEIQSSDAAATLGISAQAFADMFVSNPSDALSLVSQDIAGGIAKGMAVKFAADLFVELLFARGPLAPVPASLQNPMKAMIKATISEGMGLAMAATGSPIALVGPVLNRLVDFYQIYQATKALGETKVDGLLAVAIGLELNAVLSYQYPNERTSRVVEEWFAQTSLNVEKMVGRSDGREVMVLARNTYDALVYRMQGNENQAWQALSKVLQPLIKHGLTLKDSKSNSGMDLQWTPGGDVALASQVFIRYTALMDMVREGMAYFCKGTKDAKEIYSFCKNV